MEITNFLNSVTLYDFDNFPITRNILSMQPLNQKNPNNGFECRPGQFVHFFKLGHSCSKEFLEKKDIEVQLILLDENNKHALLRPSVSIFCNDQELTLPSSEWCPEMCTFVQRFNDPINITSHLLGDRSEQILIFYSPNGVFQNSGKLFFTIRLVHGKALLAQKSALFTRPPFSKASFLTLCNEIVYANFSQIEIIQRNKYMNSGDVLVVSERFSLQCPLSKKRLTCACRSSLCCHIDCFDGLQFLLHSYNSTVIKCPICGQIIPMESVVLDEYMNTVLESVGEEISLIEIFSDGTWKPISPTAQSNCIDLTSEQSANLADDKLQKENRNNHHIHIPKQKVISYCKRYDEVQVMCRSTTTATTTTTTTILYHLQLNNAFFNKDSFNSCSFLQCCEIQLLPSNLLFSSTAVEELPAIATSIVKQRFDSSSSIVSVEAADEPTANKHCQRSRPSESSIMDLENKQQVQKEYRSKNYPRYILEQSLVPLRPFENLIYSCYPTSESYFTRMNFKLTPRILQIMAGKAHNFEIHLHFIGPMVGTEDFPKDLRILCNGREVPAFHPKICSKTGAIIGREAHPINLLPYVIREHGDVIAQEVLIFYPAYDSTQIRCSAAIDFVRMLSLKEMKKMLIERNCFAKERFLSLLRRSMGVEDDGLMLTSERLSLICPASLSKQRLEYPCRSHNCIHLDCFDGMAFLEFYYDKADWLCPICRIPMPFENVHMDAFYMELMNKASRDAVAVNIDIDGKWNEVQRSLMKENVCARRTVESVDLSVVQDDPADKVCKTEPSVSSGRTYLKGRRRGSRQKASDQSLPVGVIMTRRGRGRGQLKNSRIDSANLASRVQSEKGGGGGSCTDEREIIDLTLDSSDDEDYRKGEVSTSLVNKSEQEFATNNLLLQRMQVNPDPVPSLMRPARNMAMENGLGRFTRQLLMIPSNNNNSAASRPSPMAVASQLLNLRNFRTVNMTSLQQFIQQAAQRPPICANTTTTMSAKSSRPYCAVNEVELQNPMRPSAFIPSQPISGAVRQHNFPRNNCVRTADVQFGGSALLHSEFEQQQHQHQHQQQSVVMNTREALQSMQQQTLSAAAAQIPLPSVSPVVHSDHLWLPPGPGSIENIQNMQVFGDVPLDGLNSPSWMQISAGADLQDIAGPSGLNFQKYGPFDDAIYWPHKEDCLKYGFHF
ncbi:E3 SUMO-protein ligase PIAS3 [Trichinella nelsoni]|uniref:E3 SUMO-protein ligase PIAS3 n=1 Tax=Trichinella nelsoni TaxID=6336 RepID=A0A0V0SLF0_9BILA|nr:E3 SUMO-protein ligase PIAS3 [Trichinella nelsoni]